MSSRDQDDTMPWEPDWDTALPLAWFTAAFFFLIAVVSAIGELLGWWDLIGEIGMSVGTTISVLVTLMAVLLSADREQVGTAGEAVRENGDKLGDVHQALVGEEGVAHELDLVQVELDKQTGVLGEQLAVLSDIRDGL